MELSNKGISRGETPGHSRSEWRRRANLYGESFDEIVSISKLRAHLWASPNKDLSEVDQWIRRGTERLARRFFEGGSSEGDFAAGIQTLAGRGASGYIYGEGGGVFFRREYMDKFYCDFQRVLIEAAVWMNNEEGRLRCVSGDAPPQRYYNAAYYYRAERARAILHESVHDLMNRVWKAGIYAPPSNPEDPLYRCFNTAWCGRQAHGVSMTDPLLPPPERFRLAYRADGARGQAAVSRGGWEARAAFITPAAGVCPARYVSAPDRETQAFLENIRLLRMDAPSPTV